MIIDIAVQDESRHIYGYRGWLDEKQWVYAGEYNRTSGAHS